MKNDSFDSPRILTVTIAFCVLVGTMCILTLRMDLFEIAMREDGPAEWATFHAFLLGSIVGFWFIGRNFFLKGLSEQTKHPRATWWTVLLLSVFCLLAAGEEISWGQRIIGIQPSRLFQELNTQQELNLHNILQHVISARLIFILLTFGYGVLLPLATPPDWRGSIAPPRWLAPWFAVAGMVYTTEPVVFSLEAAELVLGLLFLVIILVMCSSNSVPAKGLPANSVLTVVVMFTPLVLGALTTPIIDRFQGTADEALVVQARAELGEIALDFQNQSAIHPKVLDANRRLHQRLYHGVKQDLIRFGPEARFRKPNDDPSGSERRSFFVDPWGNAYWFCLKGEGSILVYSFGPNRRRDTVMVTASEVPENDSLANDDLGNWVQRKTPDSK